MTATIEPTPGFWVKEFSIDTPDGQRTYYEDTGGELMLKVAQYPATVGAVVAVTLDVDEGQHHLVQIDTYRHREFEEMTQAAAAIIATRDHLLKMHGYPSIEEYRASAGREPSAKA